MKPSSTTDAKQVSFVQKMVAMLFGAVVLWVLWGRGSPLDDAARKAAVVPSPRVASVSPAITDSLVALGLRDHIVGRSGYCTSVRKDIPVVGDLREFDAERLALVAPEILFVQPPLAGVDPALRSFCEEKHITLVARRLDSLADLRALLDDIEGAFATSDAAVATPLALQISKARAALAAPAPLAADAPRVLLVVSVDPFLAIGRGGYLDELLAAAGLANVLERTGYLELSTEELLLLKCDAIIGVSESEAGAAKIAATMRALPWSAEATPPIAARAIPELLSPSLAAAAKREALAQLVEEAK